MSKLLFNPHSIGDLELNHRIVLAPMTRIRANPETLGATDLTAAYYAQRSSKGGLLITEAIHISPEATPVWNIYPAVREHGGHVPGIWTPDQRESWKEVVDQVHAKGGLISCQLLHTGRVAQPDIGEHPLVKDTRTSLPPVSASAIPIPPTMDEGNHYNWDIDSTPPRALEIGEFGRLIGDYQIAAVNAKRAGFDFIELHAAHGYLIDQFLCNGVNQRNDKYGGSVENRCRLFFEVVAALTEIMGPDRVGVRLSPIENNPETGLPNQSYFGVYGSDPFEVYSCAIAGLNAFPLAYLLLTEPRVGGLSHSAEDETAYTHPLKNRFYRDIYDGTLIGAGGFTPLTAEAALEEDAYDLIAFGRWFLANPDLPERIQHGHPLNVYERETFYGGAEEGYTDYPTWSEVEENGTDAYSLMEQEQIGASLSHNPEKRKQKTADR